MTFWLRTTALMGFFILPVAANADGLPSEAPSSTELGPGHAPGAQVDAAADDESAAPADGEGEIESREVPVDADGTPRFTADLSDAELERRWVDDLPSLGSISVGFADAGRLINGVQVPAGDAWRVLVPEYAWGTQETVEFIGLAARAVRARFPEAPPLPVSHMSKHDGGWLRPHQSHQSGRDVDLGFYPRPGIAVAAVSGKRTESLDAAENWALIRALVTETDVAVILVDRRVIELLYNTAVAAGEDPAWLDAIFRGKEPLVQHARGHRDHFHVRFFAPRSQELGRRVQPLLAKRPDENRVAVRVRGGDTLGHLAVRYNSTVALIQNANGMRGSFLRAGQTLSIPLRGPCTRCPLPPPAVVPPRRLPPSIAASHEPTGGADAAATLAPVSSVSTRDTAAGGARP